MDWERGARLFDQYRVIPRVILIIYYAFFIHAWMFVVKWFIAFDWNALPQDQVVGSVSAAAVAGFPAVILGVLTKVLKELTQSYWSYKNEAPHYGHERQPEFDESGPS